MLRSISRVVPLSILAITASTSFAVADQCTCVRREPTGNPKTPMRCVQTVCTSTTVAPRTPQCRNVCVTWNGWKTQRHCTRYEQRCT